MNPCTSHWSQCFFPPKVPSSETADDDRCWMMPEDRCRVNSGQQICCFCFGEFSCPHWVSIQRLVSCQRRRELQTPEEKKKARQKVQMVWYFYRTLLDNPCYSYTSLLYLAILTLPGRSCKSGMMIHGLLLLFHTGSKLLQVIASR